MSVSLIEFVIPGEPVAKGRARTVPLMRDGRPVLGPGGRPVVLHHTPDKTAHYENLVKLAAQGAIGAAPPSECAIRLTVHATFTIPASWSAKRRTAVLGRPVTKRPDLDNVVKAVKDGLNGVAWRDDSQVAELIARKVYGECPGVRVSIVEVSP